MCLVLSYDYDDVESLFNGKKTITCYKFLRKCRVRGYVSPFYDAVDPNVGVVKSNRVSTQLTPRELAFNTIDFGIHVYTSKKTAERFCNVDEVVVPVLCERKDFVAINHRYKEAVFTKIRIHKRAKLGVYKW